MKQKIDLTSSYVRTNGIKLASTIYKIAEDVDFNGQQIQMPADCVLSFEGGSISNGTLTGLNTVINDNRLYGFIKSNMQLAGSFNIEKVIANWFVEVEDYKMFQRAFDFAYAISEAQKTYFSSSSIFVTCFAMSYNISRGMYLPVGVSFNGNNASFFPSSSWNTSEYMFYLNINKQSLNWEIEYPGNIEEEFCHINYCNPDNKLCHFILGGDSRYIHDIYAFRPAIFYKQIDAYIDNKHICNVVINGDNSSFPLNKQISDTYRIQWYLGDASEINHISDGVSIYIGGGANAAIRNSINATVYVSSCRNILLESFHNELGAIIAERSSIIMKNAYFYANQNGNILITGQYNVGSELFLENVFFGNLISLTDFNSYYPIVSLSTFENSRIVLKNVYGLINNGMNGHNSGNAIMLKYKNKYSNETHYINPNGEIINVGHVVNSFKHLDSNSVLPLTWSNESGSRKAYMRVLYIVDDVRKLKLLGGSLTDGEVLVNSIDSTFAYRATMYNSGSSIQQLTNLLVRIFVGTTSGRYNSYYDFGVVMQNQENFILRENGIDGLVHKRTDNIDVNYTPCISYTCNGYNVSVKLLNNQLPTIGSWLVGDKIFFPNGKIYQYNGTGWQE